MYLIFLFKPLHVITHVFFNFMQLWDWIKNLKNVRYIKYLDSLFTSITLQNTSVNYKHPVFN